MATSKDLKNQLTEQNNQAVDVSKLGFKKLMSQPAMKKKFNLSLQDQQNLFDRISRRESGEISGGNIDQQQSTIVNKPPEGNYSFNYDPPPNNFNNRISPGTVGHTHRF